jgi:hypothetical protein
MGSLKKRHWWGRTGLTSPAKSDILQKQSNWGFGMKCRKTMHLGSLFVATVLALGLATCGYGQTPAWDPVRDTSRLGALYDLCIEQSPAQAGKLSPDAGTHRVAADAVVTLSAEPQPGYQFSYWLGDVADPKAQRTTVQVNSSKIIVAVFQPADREDSTDGLIGGGGGGGSGGAVPTRIDLSTPSYSLAGGVAKSKPEIAAVPVPVPVPEPATIALLGLGALALRRRRGTR